MGLMLPNDFYSVARLIYHIILKRITRLIQCKTDTFIAHAISNKTSITPSVFDVAMRKPYGDSGVEEALADCPPKTRSYKYSFLFTPPLSYFYKRAPYIRYAPLLT